MAILSIGRAFDGIDVDVREASWSGRQLRIAGDVYLGAVAAGSRAGTAAALRDRLLALADSVDEPVVPVTWSEDSTVDGWYQVTGASVDYSVASLNDGYATWNCDLLAVQGTPQIEALTSFGVVNNDIPLTNATLASQSGGTIVGLPGSAVDSYGTGGTFTSRGAAQTRTSSDGTVAIMAGSATSLPSSTLSVWTVAPADAYEGACSIRGTYGGVASQLCLGREMSPLGGSGLVISNNLIRCGFTAGGQLSIQAYDAGAWRTVGPSAFNLTATQSPSGTSSFTLNCSAASNVTVLRNAPEMASVRLVNISGTAVRRYWLDVTVRRGSRIVEFVLWASDLGIRASVAPSTSTASTAITGGLRQTSNDANGNRFVIVGARGTGLTTGGASAYAWQATTASGTLTQGVNISTEWWSSAPFGVGCEVDGSSATGIHTAQQIAYEFFAGRSETVRVTQR